MAVLDWVVLIATLAGIITYGLYKSRHEKTLEGYFLSSRSMPWWLVLLSIMGTQASAVTFLSAPGQAYTDGMRFVQYYFGLPIAMIVISAFFVPIFHKLKVYTAYEFLEQRFDLKTRTLTSFLFLLGRGLSTGISIYAPAIIVSSLLGWNIYLTNLVMGGLLIIYTVSGGAKSIAYTQQLQFLLIMGGMLIAAVVAVQLLPAGVGFTEAIATGGSMGKMNIITDGMTEKGFDWKDRYNMWSGVIGGFFLALSYFGTDQSQVGRYLTARSMKESRIGLLMNGLVKVPMQFVILMVGVLVFAFYQFNQAPIFFNQTLVKEAKTTAFAPTLNKLEAEYNLLQEQRNRLRNQGPATDGFHVDTMQKAVEQNFQQLQSLRKEYAAVLKQAVPNGETSDTNYIFLYFVTQNLPKGLVGLLIAVIILAAWGSIAAALNSLASSTVIDIHHKVVNKNCDEKTSYKLSWQYTLGWGLFSIAVAMFATNMGSLIEAVNILGSLFYGVILGIFLVAFFIKKVKGDAVFWSAVVSELLVVTIYKMEIVSFLWLNLIGAALVIFIAIPFQTLLQKQPAEKPAGEQA
ncbi:sodium:solute symporter [Phnomibacter ginsenosidimutans]|uniref:Sodium:solute symporter n=1 Tax=Phnomibacter ginsenosidimutans TaxID=2676868 RepID=A0A6I6GT50_9BACT|nr:sodium:solute symporter [Phnomibacter ginsenosidimutans]QGW28339.1 sodium:solute symporter [Phnomibacter ginsenosidimutans]